MQGVDLIVGLAWQPVIKKGGLDSPGQELPLKFTVEFLPQENLYSALKIFQPIASDSPRLLKIIFT